MGTRQPDQYVIILLPLSIHGKPTEVSWQRLSADIAQKYKPLSRFDAPALKLIDVMLGMNEQTSDKDDIPITVLALEP